MDPLAPCIDDVHRPTSADCHVMREPELTIIVAELAEAFEGGPICAKARCASTIWRSLRLIAPVYDEYCAVAADGDTIRAAQ